MTNSKPFLQRVLDSSPESELKARGWDTAAMKRELFKHTVAERMGNNLLKMREDLWNRDHARLMRAGMSPYDAHRESNRLEQERFAKVRAVQTEAADQAYLEEQRAAAVADIEREYHTYTREEKESARALIKSLTSGDRGPSL